MAPAKKPAATTIMRCVVPGGVWFQTKDGPPIHVAEGELVRGNHAAVKHNAAWFASAEDFDAPPEVEQATAAPGEKRATATKKGAN
jgi:hypothetical protein